MAGLVWKTSGGASCRWVRLPQFPLEEYLLYITEKRLDRILELTKGQMMKEDIVGQIFPDLKLSPSEMVALAALDVIRKHPVLGPILYQTELNEGDSLWHDIADAVKKVITNGVA